MGRSIWYHVYTCNRRICACLAAVFAFVFHPICHTNNNWKFVELNTKRDVATLPNESLTHLNERINVNDFLVAFALLWLIVHCPRFLISRSCCWQMQIARRKFIFTSNCTRLDCCSPNEITAPEPHQCFVDDRFAPAFKWTLRRRASLKCANFECLSMFGEGWKKKLFAGVLAASEGEIFDYLSMTNFRCVVGWWRMQQKLNAVASFFCCRRFCQCQSQLNLLFSKFSSTLIGIVRCINHFYFTFPTHGLFS